MNDYLAAPIHSRAEVLAHPSPVPRGSGVYGWWFRELPGEIDTQDCVSRDGLTLLYAGISPKRPPTNGRAPSRQTLQSRIKTHYSGNAEGSTLRRSLGCLLAPALGLELRRYGSGTRLHFGTGEQVLSRWMNRNAFVSWLSTPQPWLLEEEILKSRSTHEPRQQPAQRVPFDPDPDTRRRGGAGAVTSCAAESGARREPD